MTPGIITGADRAAIVLTTVGTPIACAAISEDRVRGGLSQTTALAKGGAR
jgi:hypothetical protein